MSYERELTFALRLRGLTDDQIATALEEARVHVTTARSTMEEEFGTPVEYAAQFPKMRYTSLGRRVRLISVVLAVAWAAFAVLAENVFRLDLAAVIGSVTLWPSLALLTVGVVGGFLLDYLRPVRRPADG